MAEIVGVEVFRKVKISFDPEIKRFIATVEAGKKTERIAKTTIRAVQNRIKELTSPSDRMKAFHVGWSEGCELIEVLSVKGDRVEFIGEDGKRRSDRWLSLYKYNPKSIKAIRRLQKRKEKFDEMFEREWEKARYKLRDFKFQKS